MTIKYFGCHLSISDGIDTCINTIKKLNGTAFQVFLRNPKSLTCTVTSDAKKQQYKRCKEILQINNNIKCIVHSPYVLNFCNPDQYNKSVEILIFDLRDAHLASIDGCIIHLGKNTKGLEYIDAMNRFEDGIIECLQKTDNINTKIVIETGAGQGTEVGWKLKNLGSIRQNIIKKYPQYSNRIKYCIDTCHITSAGYDIINNLDIVLFYIEKYIGYDNIECIHVNDNKTPIGSFVDRHADIGYGTLGKHHLEIFIQKILEHNKNIICILETPADEINIESQIEWLSNI